MPDYIFHRSTRSELPTVVGENRIELFTADGRRFLDASGGAAVSCLRAGRQAAEALEAELLHNRVKAAASNPELDVIVDRLAQAVDAAIAEVQ